MGISRENARPDVPDWGVDLAPEARPGVPKERLPPEPLHSSAGVTQPPQVPRFEILKRVGLTDLTPVFGTAPPPHGVSGEIRRFSYHIPEYRVSHWLLLLFADRIDAVESGITDLMRRALVR
jgi:hypothetical protein